MGFGGGKRVGRGRCYSCLSASIGFNLEALMAVAVPKMRPTITEKPSERRAVLVPIKFGSSVNRITRNETSSADPTPNRPPKGHRYPRACPWVSILSSYCSCGDSVCVKKQASVSRVRDGGRVCPYGGQTSGWSPTSFLICWRSSQTSSPMSSPFPCCSASSNAF